MLYKALIGQIIFRREIQILNILPPPLLAVNSTSRICNGVYSVWIPTLLYREKIKLSKASNGEYPFGA
jgi:hypothetical protein